MTQNFSFAIKRLRFDENYNPSENTRITTNFANLARGAKRQENLRNALVMIDNRFNSLAHWDNPKADRYAVELDIISVEMIINANGG
uniref:putative oxygenase MesX n=1 Tax=Pantoea piersonii TaxID=2364647 RepID=UPI0036F304A6